MKQTAQGLAALGRGPDTQLVHMAPSEVAGLQSLAKAHGGSLTINPDTGLPEAGFLSSILPMVAGFALGPAGFGLMSSAMAGITVGGISALTSGSLSKGLMAGLGAYGGSELGVGFSNAGTGALSSGANAGMPPAAAAESIVPRAAMPAASDISADMIARGAAEGARGGADLITSGMQVPPASLAGQGVVTTTPTIAPAELAMQAGPSTGDFARFDRAYSPGLGASQMDRLGAGFTAAGNAPGAFLKANAFPIGAAGISLLAGMEPEGGGEGPPQHPGMIRPYTYTRTKNKAAFQDVAGEPMSSRERQYFSDAYAAGTPYKAPGEEYMAAGGPVEAMSNANAIGANTGYPQSDIRTGAYSNPFQQPMSQNVVTGAQDAAVEPYTGQMAFADGGSVGGYIYNPRTSLYERDTADSIYENESIGGYSYDPRTGTYTKSALKTKTPMPTVGDFSSGFSGSGGGSDNYYNPNPGPSTYSNPYAANSLTGGLVPSLIGMQEPAFNVPVENMGTYANINAMPNLDAVMSMHPGTQDSTANDGGGGSDVGIGGSDISGQSEGTPAIANGGLLALAQGGVSNLGSYSDGGRLLRGPGDGVSDSIPAMIGQKQQARLADGEFVVPARIVSELGNGSTEAGARQLYAMMDRVQKARKKSIGKDKVATNSRAAKLLPA